jgi:stage V sporulation protein SpoVS
MYCELRVGVTRFETPFAVNAALKALQIAKGLIVVVPQTLALVLAFSSSQ